MTIGAIRGHLRPAGPPRGSGGEREGARVAGGRPGAAGWESSGSGGSSASFTLCLSDALLVNSPARTGGASVGT